MTSAKPASQQGMIRVAADPTKRVPSPAHPQTRRQPLPEHSPKPTEEDPAAPQALRAIRESPTYRLAEQDVEFIARADIRGPRLEIEYLKADVILAEQHIDHTIVVYGSTRITEPGAARHKVKCCAPRFALTRTMKSSIFVWRPPNGFAKSHYYDVAREFGRLVGGAHRGAQSPRLVIMTGGGPGLMEAANRGAFDVGAKSVGLNIELPHEQFPNPYVTPDLCFRFHYFALRKLHLLLRAKALVAFPGGYGTFDELFEVLTLVQTRKIKPIPVILVGEPFGAAPSISIFWSKKASSTRRIASCFGSRRRHRTSGTASSTGIRPPASRFRPERRRPLEHDPEKWKPVFGQDHAQTQRF